MRGLSGDDQPGFTSWAMNMTRNRITAVSLAARAEVRFALAHTSSEPVTVRSGGVTGPNQGPCPEFTPACDPASGCKKQLSPMCEYGSLGGMVLEARHDSRVAIAEDDFRAFRDVNGRWTDDPPVLLIEDLREDFLSVDDADRAIALIREAKAALWS